MIVFGTELAAMDRDERLRQIKDRQNEERQRKLEELKAQALAAQKYREQKEEERKRRIDDMKLRENDKRQQVFERLWNGDKCHARICRLCQWRDAVDNAQLLYPLAARADDKWLRLIDRFVHG